MPEIRNLEPDDFKHLLVIETESFDSGYSPYFIKMIPILYGNTSFIAVKGRSAQGYIMGAIEQDNPRRAWIMSLAVRPKARGTGLGEELLLRLLDVLVNVGVKEVKLSVAPDNLKAVGLYEKHGFTSCKIVEDFFGPGQRRKLMKKIIGE